MLIGVVMTCVLATRRAKLRTVSNSEIHSETDMTSTEPIVLPWWQSPRNLVAVLIAAIVLSAGAGFVIGERNATQHPNAVDTGYLQDMRAHHEQAVEMAMIYIAKPNTLPSFHLIAKEIAFGQAVDIGRMIQLLRDSGQAEANESGTAMSWMSQPIPLGRMPGLATETDLESLISSKGADADAIFANLMIAHHEGGIHMSDYAARHANTSEVRAMAASASKSQQGEIAELRSLLAKN
jgi:uncharacterized protein (DUF305 family)